MVDGGVIPAEGCADGVFRESVQEQLVGDECTGCDYGAAAGFGDGVNSGELRHCLAVVVCTAA